MQVDPAMSEPRAAFPTLRLRSDEAASPTDADTSPTDAAGTQPIAEPLDEATDAQPVEPPPHPRELVLAIAAGVTETSELWAAHVLPERRITLQTDPNVDALLARLPGEWAFGVQVIYEGYLMHEGRSRVLHGETPDTDLLLIGDYCHAAGITDLADAGAVAVIDLMARTIAATSTAPADRRDPIWAESLGQLLEMAST